MAAPRNVDHAPHYPPNPNAPAALDATYSWATAHGVEATVGEPKTRELVEVSIGLVALTGHELEQDDLELVGQQCAWLFTWDAFADNDVGGSTQDRPPHFYEIFDVAEAVVTDPARHTDSSNPFVRTLSDIALQMKAKTKEHTAQYWRWTDAVTGYVGGVELETWYRDFGQTPSLEEFIHMRRDASGVRVVLAMIEPTEGIAVPEEAWADSTIPEATELGVDIVAWQNDRTSFPGEQRAGRAQLNMITVMQRERGFIVEEAMHEVAALCQKKWDRLLQLEYDLQQSNADPQILAYIAGVKQWNYGYLQFVRRDPRYEETS